MSGKSTMDQAYEKVLQMVRATQHLQITKLPGAVHVPLKEIVPGTRPVMLLEMN